MSTRYDILDAKAEYVAHIGRHHCKVGKCDIRIALWRKWMATGGRWGIEPGDNERQRRQFFERYPDSMPTKPSERLTAAHAA